MGFDRIADHRSVKAVRPGMEIFEAPAKTGEGVCAWLSWLQCRRDAA